jgi:hypothetical protein
MLFCVGTCYNCLCKNEYGDSSAGDICSWFRRKINGGYEPGPLDADLPDPGMGGDKIPLRNMSNYGSTNS